ncbi:MAG: DNA sulfur modification protein DndB [Sphingomicrobium sp.]|nr:DNA sulfur modification protein DndB [Sphingomonadales bacterium]
MIEHVKPTARIPAVQGQFGPRLVTYTTQLPAGAIETILGHDPRYRQWKQLPDDLNYIYQHLQRATTKARLDSIIRYIRFRFAEGAIIPGAFPAISIAVQNNAPFEVAENMDAGIGVLHFDLSRRNLRVVVDGLGRASAALELVEQSERADLPTETREALQKLLREFALPTVFYMPAPGTAPLSLDEMQQLFHDFNFKVTAVPARVAIALDHSDLYIGLTNRLGQSDTVKKYGGMELKAASLGKKSTAIVVQQNLLRFVRGATEGERFLEGSNNAEIDDPALNEETLSYYEDSIGSFIEAFAESMGEERFKDRESLHLTSPGWGALGIIFNDLVVRLKVPDYVSAARKIGELDWHRSAEIWSEIVREKVDKEGNTVLGLAGGGAQTRRFITRVIREKLGLDDLLRERGFDDDSGEAEREAA